MSPSPLSVLPSSLRRTASVTRIVTAVGFPVAAAAAIAVATAVVAVAIAGRSGAPDRPATAAAVAAPSSMFVPQFRIARPQAGLDDPGAPHGVAVAPDGTVYASDARDQRVMAYGADGTPRAAWTAYRRFAFARWEANGLAVAPDGDVLVANPGVGHVQRFAPGGVLRRAFGPDGSEASRFVHPVGVATAPDGTIYVVDNVSFRESRVFAFGPDGAPSAGWGQAPFEAPYRLGGAYHIAVAPNGSLLVAGGLSRNIVVIGRDGVPMAAWGAQGDGDGQFQRPTGIAIEPGGTVLVVDLESGKLQRLAADGTFVALVAAKPTLDTPVGVAAAPDGTIVVADSGGRLVWLAQDGTPLRIVESPTGSAAMDDLVDVATGADGAVLGLTSAGTVFGFDALGLPRGARGWWPTVRPVSVNGGLAVAPDGDVWIVDDGIAGRRVQHYRPDGTFVGDIGPNGTSDGPFNTPSDVAIGPDGGLVVTEAGGHRLWAFDATGRPTAAWGRFGRLLPGGLAGPLAVAVSQDRVIAADDDGRRLQVFDRAGRAIAAWGGRRWEECQPAGAPGPAPSIAASNIALAPDGTLWTAHDYVSQITGFAPDGTRLATWGDDPLGRPYAPRLSSLAVDRLGRVLVAERFSGAIQVFAPSPAPAWRAEWFANRWLVGVPVTVTHPVALDDAGGGDRPPPEIVDDHDASTRYTRFVAFEPGRWRATARSTGGVRVFVDGRLLFDRWGEADVRADGAIWLAGGAWEVVVEHGSTGTAGAAGRLGPVAVDFVRESDATLTPTATPTTPPPPSATPTVAPSPTATATASATPWATRLPHALFIPRLEGAAAANVPASPPFSGNPAIDVVHYGIELRLDDVMNRDVLAVVTATVRLAAPAAAVALDAEPSTIRMRSAAVGGLPAGFGWAPGPGTPWGISGTRLHVPLGRTAAAGDVVTLTLRYAVAREALVARDGQRQGMGLTLGTARPYQGLLLSRNSPYYARRWLPSNDAPWDAAAVDVVLRVPDGQVAAANGGLATGGPDGAVTSDDWATGSGPDADGLRVFRFRQAEPIPPYLIAVAAGPYAVDTAEVCFDDPAPNDPIDPDAAVPLIACAAADHRLPVVGYNVDPSGPSGTAAAAAVAYYSRHLGLWPHPKIGLLEGPHPYAMEYPGLIVNAGASAAHEVAHAWFGNRVQIAHWGDFWIKEGLAEFMASFPDRSYEAHKLCDCPTRPVDAGPDHDPMEVLSLPIQYGGGWTYCASHGAVFDLHRRTAAAAGLTIDDRPARVLMLAILRDIYRTYEGRTMTTRQLVDRVAERLPALYAASGLDVDAATARAVVGDWAARWVR